MKRMLVLLVSILVISSVAMADHIGVYGDENGQSCNLGAPGLTTTPTIIDTTTSGATGSRFKVTLPAGSTFLGFNTPFPEIGDLPGDQSLGYGGCYTGSIVLGTIVAAVTAGTVEVLPADNFASIIYTDCSFGELNATGGKGYVGSGDCLALAVEPPTWGRVKSLYR